MDFTRGLGGAEPAPGPDHTTDGLTLHQQVLVLPGDLQIGDAVGGWFGIAIGDETVRGADYTLTLVARDGQELAWQLPDGQIVRCVA